ncbi:MAG: C4-dicarboxylate ABC transporter permease [Gemmatimonadetes bacterium]|nr:C4-dicarboxylate ABC transporter permease [Gemmatimonadota bacterium]
MPDSPHRHRVVLAVLLTAFVLAEVNYPTFGPQAQLAVFAGIGLLLVFLDPNQHPILNITAALLTIFCFSYIVIQSEPMFERLWLEGQPLGNRAGAEVALDNLVGFLGLILVLEATRRAIGVTLPILALCFTLYANLGAAVPDFLFPHRGYGWERIVSQTFLHTQGVFGIALRVMFTYVFLFVLFGALLEKTRATNFIIQFSSRLFRSSRGAPAKVAVLSSGMMGSLSGSAVANTATTGTFTIPLMRSAGFSPAAAAGIEAAASSGGALVPPIMGAGAYMMLEIVDPPVTFLQIIQAALIPALLYYGVLLLIVHLQAAHLKDVPNPSSERTTEIPPVAGIVFLAAFVSLIGLLVAGYTPFRAVSVSLAVIVIAGMCDARTRLGVGDVFDACRRAANAGIPLIAAAACVGVIIGIVTLTGVGSRLPGVILPLAQQNLVLALGLLMVSTIILGMGLPSAVCYLLMATLVGPVLGELGVVPLAAHLFIFYFGMMSMVTPPVALAAYTASAIAGSGIMSTGLAAFRYALVGFALPYCFVLRPDLLLLADGNGAAATLATTGVTVVGLIPLAQSVTGRCFVPYPPLERALLMLAAFAILILGPAMDTHALVAIGAGAAVLITTLNFLRSRRSGP